MKKNSLFLIVIIVLFSCNEEVKITFKEQNIALSKNATIDINYPKAEGTSTIANKINSTIEAFIINQTNMSEDSIVNISIDKAVKLFDSEYEKFKEEFADSEQKWEALIDGEVTYESPELISIAINSYLDTGGAHGNGYIKFFNFNPENGNLLDKKDLINDLNGFSKVVELYLQQETEAHTSEEDFFFGKDFQLPETIGFSDEGVIILYNTYEIASYAQGVTEFTIPYNEVKSFLKISPHL